jgi:hypothetical protein
MALKYSKWLKSITIFYIPRPSKIYPNLDFWFENKPLGNPAVSVASVFVLIWVPEVGFYIKTRFAPSCPYQGMTFRSLFISINNTLSYLGTKQEVFIHTWIQNFLNLYLGTIFLRNRQVICRMRSIFV